MIFTGNISDSLPGPLRLYVLAAHTHCDICDRYRYCERVAHPDGVRYLFLCAMCIIRPAGAA